MLKQSRYVIPCVCGATVESHDRETTCSACRRILSVEWGRDPEIHVGNKPSQATLFERAPDGWEPTR